MEDNSVFMEYFGISPMTKVLDFLIDGKNFDYSMTDIAKQSGVGWSSFSRVWKKLLNKNIVTQTRKIGNAKLFKLNTKNPAVQKLVRLDWELTKFETDKFLSKKKLLANS
jgi:DNA-binding transcriptional ArsR family regulator